MRIGKFLNDRKIALEERFELKTPSFPEGFSVIQDSREQAGLFLKYRGTGWLPSIKKKYPGLIVTKETLTDGDYTIKGFKDVFCIERKSSDIYAYVARDRAKTIKKMERFFNMVQNEGFVGLVIEAYEADLLLPAEFTKVTPEQVRQALVSWEVKYGVHIYCSRSKNDIRRWVLDRMIKFYKTKRGIK